MKHIAALSREEREELFLNTAHKVGMPPAIVEKDVVAFKKKFYRCPWAKYEEAVPGSVKLIPSEQYFPELQKDYSKMKNMIYGIVPSFDQIIDGIRKLETEINSL